MVARSGKGRGTAKGGWRGRGRGTAKANTPQEGSSDEGVEATQQPTSTTNPEAPPAIHSSVEVSWHDKRDDCWVIINNNIWDITDWLNQLPNSEEKEAIFKHAGRDASRAFNAMPELQEVWDKTTAKFLGNQYPPRADGGDPRMPIIPEGTELTGDLKYPAWGRWGTPSPPRAQGTDGDEASRGWEAPSDNTRKRASEFGLRMSHGWTVSDGTFEPIPQDKRRKRDVPYPTYVSYSYRSRSALSSLQLSRDAPISMTALDITLDHLWKCMPGEASRYLHINLPNGPALWGDNEAAKTAMYAKMSEKKYHLPISGKHDETEYRLYSDLKKRPWIIWPLWVEDKWGSDYVTVIWHSQNTIDNVDLFDQLVSYAIIDPRRSPDPDGNQRHQPIEDRHVRLQARLAELWSRAGMDVKNIQELDVRCSPMPFDEATSGERCFAVVKGLINQIIDWFTSGMEYYNDSTITSMSQWVNPYQQRIEMTGICAWVLMATLDYNARISVEAILPNTRWDVAADGKKKYLYPYDLAGPFEEPPIASYDYLLPSNKMYSWYSTEKTTEK